MKTNEKADFKRVCTVPREGPPIYHDGSMDYWEWERRFNEDRNRTWNSPVVDVPKEQRPVKKARKKKSAKADAGAFVRELRDLHGEGVRWVNICKKAYQQQYWRMPDKQTCLEFGRQEVEVEVVE